MPAGSLVFLFVCLSVTLFNGISLSWLNLETVLKPLHAERILKNFKMF